MTGTVPSETRAEYGQGSHRQPGDAGPGEDESVK